MQHDRNKASKLNRLGMELSDQGKTTDAINAYRKAIEADPDFSDPYYNLGLIYKYRHDWRNSLKYNLKAAELDPADPPSWWNLGIAATALKDWKTAKFAWRGFGIPLPPDNEDEELRLKIGMTPVRLSENKEVIWIERIDPARGFILNVPTPDSKRRYRDLILNDGAPMGTRTVDGQQFPVFEELQLLQASDYQTYSVWVSAPLSKWLDTLSELCEKANVGCENWTHTLRHVCKQCSEGNPHEVHDRELEKDIIDGQFNLGMAAKSQEKLDKVLAAWKAESQAVVISLERVL